MSWVTQRRPVLFSTRKKREITQLHIVFFSFSSSPSAILPLMNIIWPWIFNILPVVVLLVMNIDCLAKCCITLKGIHQFHTFLLLVKLLVKGHIHIRIFRGMIGWRRQKKCVYLGMYLWSGLDHLDDVMQFKQLLVWDDIALTKKNKHEEEENQPHWLAWTEKFIHHKNKIKCMQCLQVLRHCITSFCSFPFCITSFCSFPFPSASSDFGSGFVSGFSLPKRQRDLCPLITTLKHHSSGSQEFI